MATAVKIGTSIGISLSQQEADWLYEKLRDPDPDQNRYSEPTMDAIPRNAIKDALTPVTSPHYSSHG